MGLVSNVGLGSGIDISTLVKQLVDSERAGPSAALNRREARTKAQISALGQVRSAFDQLRTAVTKLRNGTAFDGRSVGTDNERMSASIKTAATPAFGNYQIEITSLATAQKLQSQPSAVAAADTPLSAGTLSLSAGGKTTTVEVAEGDTIYQLASAINAAAGGTVQAAVIRGDDGYSLSLTAGKTGSDGRISVAQTAGDDTLAAFTYDPDAPDPSGLQETTAAADAEFFVDGVRRTSSSNNVGDAIEGLDLVLKQAEVGKTFQLKVSGDTSGARQAVEGFVSTYNTALDVLAKVSSADLDAKTAEALNGDAFVRSATAQLRQFVGDAIGAAAKAGIKPGIDTQINGKLTFKSVDFQATLQSNPDALKSLFAGENAVLTRDLSPYLDGLIGKDGVLIRRTSNLNDALKRVEQDRSALDRRMFSIEERYRKQFIALDGLLGQLNQTSQYLGQQLASLPKPGG